jgi:AcrR family transcriptional regulator
MTTARARRPRVEGPREREIFDATMSLLGEVGYDRLTLDTVAARVKVSKATIYRRWGDKSDLVNAAMECQDETELTLPDTGSVLDDMRALSTMPGFFDAGQAAVICGLATAIHREPERHEATRRRLVDNGTKHVRALLERAVQRGELVDDVDIDMLCSIIPAIVLFQMTYQTVGTFGSHLVADIVDQIVAPVLRQKTIDDK